jgi:hypothetical protein
MARHRRHHRRSPEEPSKGMARRKPDPNVIRLCLALLLEVAAWLRTWMT